MNDPTSGAGTEGVTHLSLSEKADRLNDELKGLSQAVRESKEAFTSWAQGMAVYSRNSRRMLLGLVVAFLLQLLLVVWLYEVTQSNRERIRDIEALGQRACEETNEVRQRNIILWEEVFRLRDEAPHPERTQEELERLASFREFVAKTFAPRDCSVSR